MNTYQRIYEVLTTQQRVAFRKAQHGRISASKGRGGLTPAGEADMRASTSSGKLDPDRPTLGVKVVRTAEKVGNVLGKIKRTAKQSRRMFRQGWKRGKRSLGPGEGIPR